AAATPRADVVPLPARDRLRAPLAGLAIAASVAALSVVLVAGNRGEPTVTPALEVAQSGAVAPSVPAAAPAVDSIVGDEASGLVPAGAYDQRMNGYLVNFNEQRARLGMPGVHPYVRIVGFEQR
ncbi:MAG: anti-sigma 24 factor, partial [Gammaproteobacteria bacterium]|nr:anti-sigma 24 factor [Gammaproteobacteria bacterium]